MSNHHWFPWSLWKCMERWFKKKHIFTCVSLHFKVSIRFESCIYMWQAFIISLFIYTIRPHALWQKQKQANRVVSLMVWHVISVGIWHSGLYEGMNKDIFVILFYTCVQQCSGAVSLTFGTERIVPVSDCSWIDSSLQRGASEVFWTQKCAKWCTLTAETKPARHQHMLGASESLASWLVPPKSDFRQASEVAHKSNNLQLKRVSFHGN